MRPLGKHQLKLLATMGSPFRALVVGDALSESLCKRGLMTKEGKVDRYGSFVRVTPAGLRYLAEALERGDLEQFVDKRFRPNAS